MGPTRALKVFGEEYVENMESSVQCLPMIETFDALENLDSILSVEGVDAIYVGPSDLSVNLGLPKGNNDGNRKFDEALERIVSSCEKHGVVPGIHANSSLAATRQEQGFRVLTVVEDDGAMDTEFQRVFKNQAKRRGFPRMFGTNCFFVSFLMFCKIPFKKNMIFPTIFSSFFIVLTSENGCEIDDFFNVFQKHRFSEN